MKKLFALMLAAILLTGCAAPAAPAVSPLLAAPVYPEMAPYPNEMEFVDPDTGEFDSHGFDAVYQAWRNDHSQQRAPAGYADTLKGFWRDAIPAFLDFGAENPVCSPLSLYLALALLAEATDGPSREEIMSLLNVGTPEELRTQASLVWNAHYCADGASACTLASSLWLDDSMTYDADTVSRLAEHYYASVFQGDLGSEEMDGLLQDWINQQTQGLLSEQAGHLHMDPQTVLALASSVCYRAKWSQEFRSQQTTQATFHSAAGDQTAAFMHQTLAYGPYYWTEDCAAISLPLEDGSRMWLFLPDEDLTPADLLTSGHALDLMLAGNVWENQKSLRVNLSLPKFDIAAEGRMDHALQRLGITSVFSASEADFSPILPEQASWLDAVNHAARVKIDEEGVEAAAYTVMMVAGAGMPPEDEMDFVLDRPFLFAITSRDGLPLFAGAVNTIG